MTRRLPAALAAVFLLLAPAASRADIIVYHQNLETLVMADPAALQNDGWLVYGNVFDPSGVNYLYGYGPFPAPNGGNAFSGIVTGEGGAEQGAQQLSIYNDYNNLDHALGNQIESNVYREWTIGAGQVGDTWTFQFDAKLGNLVPPSTALAFIKTLDPANGYALTNFLTVDVTAIPTTWATYSISLPITAGLAGQLFQVGFLSRTTGYISSGIFYDNLHVFRSVGTGVGDAPRATGLALRPAAPNPFRSSTRIDYALAQRGHVDLGVYDVTGRRIATLFRGAADAGSHAATWDGRSADGQLAPAGVYRCVLQTPAGRESRSLVLSR